jgi:hypothetical protein
LPRGHAECVVCLAVFRVQPKAGTKRLECLLGTAGVRQRDPAE